MSNYEYITLFFSKTYEKTIDKLIRDDKDYVLPFEQLNNYVQAVISIPYREYIDYIRNHQLSLDVDSKDITQSSSFSACEIEMCNALIWADNRGFDYLEIGKLFPQYVSHPNDSAYRKYGENQIKTSAHLGLVYEYYKYWYLSCLGYIYPKMKEGERLKLLARTILRTPLYYKMMVDLMNADIELTKYMQNLSRATQLRREGSVYRLLEICIKECNEEGIEIHQIIRPSGVKHNIVSYDFVASEKKMHQAAEPQIKSETIQKNNDNIETKKLKLIYENKATSYKYFWFLAIISLAKKRDSLSISYKDILIRMVALAWPIVMEHGIDLGKKDLIKKYLQEIDKKERFAKGVPFKVVEYHLRLHYSLYRYENILSPLLLNVPYRFLSPWIKFTSNEDVVKKTRHEDFDGLYALYPDRIIINDKWWKYIQSHYKELCDFSFNSFMEYVKQYNSVFRLLKLKSTGRMI